jgi:transposase InsO family protein
VADITQQRTGDGWLYLAVVLDSFSRRIVGWSMADHLRTELVLDALDMAIAQRQPAAGLIHHTDHGCQYTNLTFGRRLQQAGLVASIGTVGDALDNAAAESFFATSSASCWTAMTGRPVKPSGPRYSTSCPRNRGNSMLSLGSLCGSGHQRTPGPTCLLSEGCTSLWSSPRRAI